MHRAPGDARQRTDGVLETAEIQRATIADGDRGVHAVSRSRTRDQASCVDRRRTGVGIQTVHGLGTRAVLGQAERSRSAILHQTVEGQTVGIAKAQHRIARRAVLHEATRRPIVAQGQDGVVEPSEAQRAPRVDKEVRVRAERRDRAGLEDAAIDDRVAGIRVDTREDLRPRSRLLQCQRAVIDHVAGKVCATTIGDGQRGSHPTGVFDHRPSHTRQREDAVVKGHQIQGRTRRRQAIRGCSAKGRRGACGQRAIIDRRRPRIVVHARHRLLASAVFGDAQRPRSGTGNDVAVEGQVIGVAKGQHRSGDSAVLDGAAGRADVGQRKNRVAEAIEIEDAAGVHEERRGRAQGGDRSRLQRAAIDVRRASVGVHAGNRLDARADFSQRKDISPGRGHAIDQVARKAGVHPIPTSGENGWPIGRRREASRDALERADAVAKATEVQSVSGTGDGDIDLGVRAKRRGRSRHQHASPDRGHAVVSVHAGENLRSRPVLGQRKRARTRRVHDIARKGLGQPRAGDGQCGGQCAGVLHRATGHRAGQRAHAIAEAAEVERAVEVDRHERVHAKGCDRAGLQRPGVDRGRTRVGVVPREDFDARPHLGDAEGARAVDDVSVEGQVIGIAKGQDRGDRPAVGHGSEDRTRAVVAQREDRADQAVHIQRAAAVHEESGSVAQARR